MNLSHRYARALRFAFSLHQQHQRKGGGVPYVAHLLSVSALVLEYGGDEDQSIAALLHDAVEDQGGVPTGYLIRSEFGNLVADIVDGCTDATTIPKPPWRQRKEQYLAHLQHASPAVLLVSSCDKLHNARSIVSDLRTVGEQVWKRFAGGKEGSLWYYQSLAETFTKRGALPAKELAVTVGLMTDLSAADALTGARPISSGRSP
jgi:(p)ppGpp synthase/HD superfamily hydrolase